MLTIVPYVVMTFFSIRMESVMTDTSQACDYHVNSSWIGNSSCIPTRDSECHVLVNCRLGTMTVLGQLISYPDFVYSL
jgi:hypothetical protein